MLPDTVESLQVNLFLSITRPVQSKLSWYDVILIWSESLKWRHIDDIEKCNGFSDWPLPASSRVAFVTNYNKCILLMCSVLSRYFVAKRLSTFFRACRSQISFSQTSERIFEFVLIYEVFFRKKVLNCLNIEGKLMRFGRCRTLL